MYPLEGKKNKDWRITSGFGPRLHPIEKIKKHHNGDDLWGPASTMKVRSWTSGTVVAAGTSKLRNKDGSLGGVGYYVDVRSKVDGSWYTTRYAHLRKDSLRVVKGQKIVAGEIVGIMGNTGASTARHLHIEICRGRTIAWNLFGKGYVSPIKFIEEQISKEKLANKA